MSLPPTLHHRYSKMKKISLLTLSLALTALSIHACSQDKSSVLRGTDLPSEMEGQYVYLYDGQAKVDSALVKDGSFEVKMPQETSTKIYTVLMGSKGMPFFSEPGTSTLVVDGDNFAYDPGSTELNKKVTTLYSRFNALYGDFMAANQQLMQEVQAGGGTITEEISAKGEKLSDDFNTKVAALSREYFDDNKDNAFGLLALSIYPMTDPKGFVEMYESAGEAVTSNEDMQKLYAMQKGELKTASGSPYADVTMTDETGKSVKLSNYMEDGKYLLVDVWASWCGPCRAAMPHLAEIAKSHAGTINVLSVGGLNETPEANAKAREELGMTWSTFFDSKSSLADAYGVKSIPTLILISPEGTIVLKTNRPDEISDKISELGL